MGITGALPLLRRAGAAQNFRRHELEAAASVCRPVLVDASVLLHQIAGSPELGLAREAAFDTDTWRSALCKEFGRRIGILKALRFVPHVVFDGGGLPAKRAESLARCQKLAAVRRKADAVEKNDRGTAEWRGAYRTTDATVRALMKALTARGVTYQVAPYEADAQLAHLWRTRKAAFVISNDSDIVALYGATLATNWEWSPREPECEVFDARGPLLGGDLAVTAASPLRVLFEARVPRLTALLSYMAFWPTDFGKGLPGVATNEATQYALAAAVRDTFVGLGQGVDWRSPLFAETVQEKSPAAKSVSALRSAETVAGYVATVLVATRAWVYDGDGVAHVTALGPVRTGGTGAEEPPQPCEDAVIGAGLDRAAAQQRASGEVAPEVAHDHWWDSDVAAASSPPVEHCHPPAEDDTLLPPGGSVADEADGSVTASEGYGDEVGEGSSGSETEVEGGEIEGGGGGGGSETEVEMEED